jgi:hypothetical protein
MGIPLSLMTVSFDFQTSSTRVLMSSVKTVWGATKSRAVMPGYTSIAIWSGGPEGIACGILA